MMCQELAIGNPFFQGVYKLNIKWLILTSIVVYNKKTDIFYGCTK